MAASQKLLREVAEHFGDKLRTHSLQARVLEPSVCWLHFRQVKGGYSGKAEVTGHLLSGASFRAVYRFTYSDNTRHYRFTQA